MTAVPEPPRLGQPLPMLLLGLTLGALIPLALLGSQLLNLILGYALIGLFDVSFATLKALHPLLPVSFTLALLWGAHHIGRDHAALNLSAPTRRAVRAALTGGLITGLLLWHLSGLHFPGPVSWTAAAALFTAAFTLAHTAGLRRRI